MVQFRDTILLVTLSWCMLALPTWSYGQRKGSPETGLTWADGIVVDGNLEDWGDSLTNRHDSQGLQYQIKNDGTNLYVAMRVMDRDRQMQALSQGFSFMINTDGKRRPGATIVYPIADRLSFRSIMSDDNDDRPEDMRVAGLQAIRAIYVLRFEEILDGQISLDNEYGILAEARIDSADALCLEAAVPLRRLGVNSGYDKPLAFNVKINGMIAPRGNTNTRNVRQPGGYYGYPYGYGFGGYGQQAQSRPREEPGTWLVSLLSRPNH